MLQFAAAAAAAAAIPNTDRPATRLPTCSIVTDADAMEDFVNRRQEVILIRR